MTTARLRKQALHAATHGPRADAQAAVDAYVAAIRASMGPNRWQRAIRWYRQTPVFWYTIGWAEKYPRAAWATSSILAAAEVAYLAWR